MDAHASDESEMSSYGFDINCRSTCKKNKTQNDEGTFLNKPISATIFFIYSVGLHILISGELAKEVYALLAIFVRTLIICFKMKIEDIL